MEKFDGYWSADRNKLVNSFTGDVVDDVLLYSRKIHNWMDNIGGIVFYFADKAQNEHPNKTIKIDIGIEVMWMLYDSNVYEWDDCTFIDPNYKPNKFYGVIRNPDDRNGVISIKCDNKVLYKIKVLDLDVFRREHGI